MTKLLNSWKKHASFFCSILNSYTYINIILKFNCIQCYQDKTTIIYIYWCIKLCAEQNLAQTNRSKYWVNTEGNRRNSCPSWKCYSVQAAFAKGDEGIKTIQNWWGLGKRWTTSFRFSKNAVDYNTCLPVQTNRRVLSPNMIFGMCNIWVILRRNLIHLFKITL